MGRRPVEEIGDCVHYIRKKQLDLRYRVLHGLLRDGANRWRRCLFSFSVSAPTSAGEIFRVGADLVGKCEQIDVWCRWIQPLTCCCQRHAAPSVDRSGDVPVALQTLNRSDGDHRRRSADDVLADDPSHVFGRHRADPRLELGGGHAPAVAQDLAADVFTDRRRAVQHEQHVGQQQVLGSAHLVVRGSTTQSLPLGQHRVHRRVHGAAVRD